LCFSVGVVGAIFWESEIIVENAKRPRAGDFGYCVKDLDSFGLYLGEVGCNLV